MSEGEWLVSADGTDTVKNYIFSAKLKGGLIARPVIGKKEDWSPQALQTNTNPLGRQALEVPHGYSTENWEPPKDLYGRNQLFEPTGIAVAKDGTIIVATRSAGIWRIRDNKWSLFAEGPMRFLGLLLRMIKAIEWSLCKNRN